MSLDAALESLRRGEFVLLHDSDSRENEVDMVAAAQHATPGHVARMRQHAGGLICVALGAQLASAMRLEYMHDLLASSLDERLRGMAGGASPYGDLPSFSISVNHRDTYTGVTDRDRALTIRSIAGLAGAADPAAGLADGFRAPGHVPLLVASSLGSRRGHTEMSVYMAGLAGLAPAAAICEMMDASTHSALSAARAREYAAEQGIEFVDGAELVERAGVRSA